MRDEDKWPALHAYRKAVVMGEAPAIRCPDCDAELVPAVGTTGAPALRCYACGVGWGIGLDTWDQIAASIGEVVQTLRDIE